MKKFIRNIFAVLIFSLAGYTSAAREITRHDVTNLMPLGYISVGNLLTLDEVVNALDDKAEELGATQGERMNVFCIAIKGHTSALLM